MKSIWLRSVCSVYLETEVINDIFFLYQLNNWKIQENTSCACAAVLCVVSRADSFGLTVAFMSFNEKSCILALTHRVLS